MRNIIFYIAILGLSLSILVHLLSIQGYVLSENFPIVWGLHLLVFVVWFPTIITLIQNPEIKALRNQRSKNPFKMWIIIFKDTPKVVTILVLAIFIYTIFGFIFFMGNSEGGGSGIIDGQYVLSNHSEILREFTKAEYHSFLANELRGFSSIWLAFFSMAMAMMWPKENVL